VRVDRSQGQVWLPTRGMEIGLGRMGKEYAADPV
jgi:hypothetical protein